MFFAGDIFREAQTKFALQARKSNDESGTTATVAVVTKESIMLAYVGDSRACIIKANGSGAFRNTNVC